MTRYVPGAPDYGASHQRTRKAWASAVASGKLICWICNAPIRTGDRWDLDHADDHRHYRGPTHAHCNRSLGARKGNAHRWRNREPEPPPQPQSRPWG